MKKTTKETIELIIIIIAILGILTFCTPFAVLLPISGLTILLGASLSVGALILTI